ncbi:MAG: hypothetical protein FWC93_06765 [Defluviitaleaceae bacterium]|nr:hypothetical protein [Defluviitaleaceae bacterium]
MNRNSRFIIRSTFFGGLGASVLGGLGACIINDLGGRGVNVSSFPTALVVGAVLGFLFGVIVVALGGGFSKSSSYSSYSSSEGEDQDDWYGDNWG